ncbi:MAG: precorrin-8X methylmutase [Desulfovibrio sp.]|nr:precorrin-8X methylmutase [Desulfovibrio sp.]MCA1985585.1 precorrin-8X methylmutase [Desulfovibrio sp.]
MNILPIADPAAIEAASMAIIDQEAGDHPWTGPAWTVVRRLIHTSADFDMLHLVRMHSQAIEAGVALLRQGAPIITDTQMCRAGVPARRLSRFGNTVHCLMDDADVAELVRQTGGTRARAAVTVACRRFHGLTGAVMAVGNAPTALLALQEAMDRGEAAPGLVVAMPVGFVNAAESKALVMARNTAPWIAIAGRKGGSALAAATVNALLELAFAESC